MLFFIDNNGTVIAGKPSPVYQGSAGTNNIVIVAPFAANLTATVAFTLPNGANTEPYNLTAGGALNGIELNATNATMAIWTFSLPNEITALAGTVSAQFTFYGVNGQITATSLVTFPVAKGVQVELPSTPTQDIYNQLLTALSQYSTQLNSGAYPARAIYWWINTFTYGQNEITFYPVGDYGAFVRSLTTDNTNNQPYNAQGVLNSKYWLEVVNFNTLNAAITEATESAQNAAESAQQAAESATAAATSQQGAQSAANIAGGYATNALGSANLAAGSATQAAGSAGQAGDFATEAAASAELARQYAELGVQPNTDYTSVSALPIPGSTKFIYLIPKTSASDTNTYDEYIWVPSKNGYELIGSTAIDISGKVDRLPATSTPQVYVADATTGDTKGVPLAPAATPNTIPERDGNGNLSVGTPVNDSDAASKEYVDGQTANMYVKPSTGIPESDLSATVQNSLAKADSALQSIPIASQNVLGGVKPVTATSEMTQPVGSDETGALFTKPANVPELPTPTTSDNDKFLTVSNGQYALAPVFSELSNPNILINSNFKINQRGESVYNQLNYDYTVDRWRMEGGSSVWTLSSVTPVSNGLKINNGQGVTITVDQPIEEGLIVSGETYTLSATVDGVEKSISFAVSSTTRTLSFTNASITFSTDSRTGADYKVSLNVYAGRTVTFNNVKLEKGEQATAYVTPEPTIERLRCYRYYQKFTGVQAFAGSTSASTNIGYFGFDLIVPMRDTPTVSYSSGNVRTLAGQKSLTGVAMQSGDVARLTKMFLKLSFSTSGVTSLTPAFANVNDLAFDAEI